MCASTATPGVSINPHCRSSLLFENTFRERAIVIKMFRYDILFLPKNPEHIWRAPEKI
jgi:hypothetical protein